MFKHYYFVIKINSQVKFYHFDPFRKYLDFFLILAKIAQNGQNSQSIETKPSMGNAQDTYKATQK